jgi:endonuclease/exonuclease/phosphatase (EEP) superfamily protein YafD
MRKGWRALNLILMLAAAPLVVATVGALAARHWWVFDLFSHFRLQYVIAAGLLCIAALALRAYPTAAVLAAVALVHGFAIKDLWLGGGARAAPGGLPLRVVSANVWGGNRTPDKVLELVRTSAADLVVLVDATRRRWQPVLAGIGALYPYTTGPVWGRGRAPVILFSRFPILSENLLQAPRGRRPYLVAKLDLGGETLVVVGVHSSSPRPTGSGHSRLRNRELDHIAEAVRGVDGPVIATGDFNVTAWSPHFEDLLAAGLRDAALGQGYLATWPTWFWPALIPIDHVLLKGPLAVTSVRRGPAVGSDHFPLIADLRLLGADPRLGAAARSAPGAGAGARDARAAGRAGPAAAPDAVAAAAEHENQRHAGDEAADVRPERDTGLARIGPEPAQQLEHEPEAEQPARGHGPQPHQAEPDQDVHAGMGKQQQIGAEHARDRAARPDHWHLRARIGQRLGERRRHPAGEIEREEAAVAADVLDVIPEDPEIEHVAGQMHQAAVQEHRAEQRGAGRDHREVRRQLRVGEQECWDEAEAVDRGGPGLRPERHLPEIDQDAGGDQRDRDDRQAAGRIVVVDRKHRAFMPGWPKGDAGPYLGAAGRRKPPRTCAAGRVWAGQAGAQT